MLIVSAEGYRPQASTVVVGGEPVSYDIAELVPGPLTLAVTAAGYRPIALPVEIAAQGVTRTELEPFPGLHVRGMVQAAGRPLNDARVTLIGTAGGEYTVTAAGYPPKATQVTVHGSFRRVRPGGEEPWTR